MPSEKQSKINWLGENRLMKGLVASLIVINVSMFLPLHHRLKQLYWLLLSILFNLDLFAYTFFLIYNHYTYMCIKNKRLFIIVENLYEKCSY